MEREPWCGECCDPAARMTPSTEDGWVPCPDCNPWTTPELAERLNDGTG